MRWYPFTSREAIVLLAIFVAAGIFSNLQPLFIAPALRPYTYALVLFLLMMAGFPAARPADPVGLGKFLSVLLGVIFAGWILLQDVILRQNLSWGIAAVLGSAILSPLIAGWSFRLATRGRGA